MKDLYSRTRGLIPLAVAGALFPAGLQAQLGLTTSGSPVVITFDATLSGVGDGVFAGAGFQSSPAAGQLDSDAWAVTGWSNGNLAFGGAQTTAGTDYTRGTTAAAQTTGGMYAFTNANIGSSSLGIQPGGSDWAPGTLTLRIQNNTPVTLSSVDVAYELWVRNDQPRGNSFNFSWSTDDVTYTPVPALDYTSPLAADGLGFVLNTRSTTVTSLSIPSGGFFYVRWSGADAGGSGSRDEFALDDITITGTGAGAPTPIVGFTLSSQSVAEGGTASVGVSMNIAPVANVTVDIADLLTGTATSASDYPSFSATTLTFTPADTYPFTQTVNFPTTGDPDYEANETVNLQLSVTGGTANLGTSAQQITILNDDLPSLVINEVDYDQDGTDALEFIELKNTGATAIPLDGLKVQLINGSTNLPYFTFNLPNVTLAVGDYFVICGTGSSVANCDFQSGPATNLIQNGAPDGVALLTSTDVIIDAMTYEGNITGYTEGSGVGLDDDPALIPSYEQQGLSRFPDGVDTDQNNVDFSLRCVTPGAANGATNQFCLCEPPTFTVNPVCVDDFTWDVLVNVTDLGSSAAVDIFNDLNFDFESAVGTGVYTIGTFNNLDLVAITVTHDTYAQCNVTIGSITEDCTPPPPCTENEMALTINTDTYPGEITWVIQEAGGGPTVCSGGPYFQQLSTITESCCLPNGCYELVLFDSFGDGLDAPGSYVLADEQGQRVLDSDGSYGATGTANNPFCVPVGFDRPIFQQCDKEDWLPTGVIVATENPAVSDEWTVGDQTDDGYQFWFFDADGGYSRRIFRSHAASGGFGPANATRACHLKLSSIVTLPLPTNRLLNVRIRSRVNGTYNEFGPACRFRIPSPAVTCPTTKLIDNPNNANFSCGVTRAFGASDKVHCYPVAGASHYRFRFEADGGGFVRQITITSTNLVLNWATLPLQNGVTYDVTVQASLDNAATFCPAGDVCTVSISNPPSAQARSMSATNAPSFTVFPNPNDGSSFTVRLSDLGATSAVVLEVIDSQGRLVTSRGLAVVAGRVDRTIAFDQQLPTGLYLVRLTAGDRVLTERLVVRR
ncbi:MAG: lamin tail domain-containing protein [Flavobacteriales bacterium]|nr:lamin tail domain-containing protein [Flavobacteriales bacterium]